jgi:hypothetical protein
MYWEEVRRLEWRAGDCWEWEKREEGEGGMMMIGNWI